MILSQKRPIIYLEEDVLRHLPCMRGIFRRQDTADASRYETFSENTRRKMLLKKIWHKTRKMPREGSRRRDVTPRKETCDMSGAHVCATLPFGREGVCERENERDSMRDRERPREGERDCVGETDRPTDSERERENRANCMMQV